VPVRHTPQVTSLMAVTLIWMFRVYSSIVPAWGTEFFPLNCIQNDWRAHKACYRMSTGAFISGIKRPGHQACYTI
jgi:hypothetical protein